MWKVPWIEHFIDIDAFKARSGFHCLVALVVCDPTDCAVPVVEIYR